MAEWEAVIGLEVHVQLATASKLFCGAPVGDATGPNQNVDPVTPGMPGVLPVLNREALANPEALDLFADLPELTD